MVWITNIDDQVKEMINLLKKSKIKIRPIGDIHCSGSISHESR